MSEGLQALSLHMTADWALTFGPLAFTAYPQIEQCWTLFQEGIGVLHTNSINFINTELELSGQLYMGIREDIFITYMTIKHYHWSLATTDSVWQTAMNENMKLFILKRLWPKHYPNFVIKETVRLQICLEKIYFNKAENK